MSSNVLIWEWLKVFFLLAVLVAHLELHDFSCRPIRDIFCADFRTTNTFDAIANSCEISYPEDEEGKCPGDDAEADCY